MTGRIYLDHAATTPLDRRVLDAMLPVLTEAWGNPSSIYHEARAARRALDGARREVATVLGARPAEIIFTAGGSESDNLALRGVVAARGRGGQVITSATEHHAVLHTVQALERAGACAATYLPVDHEGVIDLTALEQSLNGDTVLVSVMLANNETGTIQPLGEIVRLVRRHAPRALIHTDAVQAAGALPVNVDALGVDLLSLAAHKFYGPKGVGALYLRRGTPLTPQLLGGAQERDRRAGTENVAGAVGLATALRLAADELSVNVAHAAHLRDRLLDELPTRIADTLVTGPHDRRRRLANNASFCFPGVESEALLMQLDLAGVAASSGSACTTASLEPSHVLTAMGISAAVARSSLRLTTGRASTDADIDRVVTSLPGFIARLRTLRERSGVPPAPVSRE